MKTQMILMICSLLFGGMLSAQVTLGTLKGQIYNEDSTETIPTAKVWIEGGGNTYRTTADVTGKFTFEALKPGVYVLKATSLGLDTTTFQGVEIIPDAITNLNEVALVPASTTLGVVDVIWTPPMIREDVQKIEISTEDIKHSPNIRNPKELFASMNSDINIPEGSSDVIIRGSRPGDVTYFVDGVKTDDLNGVPGVGIGSMTGYTGGIPAKYGDTTGGVIILETKSYFDLYYAWLARQ